MRRFVGASDARESDKDQSLVRWVRILELLFLSLFSYCTIIIIIIVTIVLCISIVYHHHHQVSLTKFCHL